ncbi:SRPBCC family protein [Luteococcus sp. Sow4_B9]|uniref:SRPBCC family protein n=1 Tax=Luteococcus sp. Sow4_B9 TaxID=3438792 RepID=UPI003F978660
MPVVDTKADLKGKTLTIVAEFQAPIESVWQVYADPRLLERVWGPEGMPATFTLHDLAPGGRMNYFMTDPEGQKYCGYWEVIEVHEPHHIAVMDGFANQDFTPNPELPASRNDFDFEPIDGGTRATYTSHYASADELQAVLDMGVIEGATSAINQIDGLLARS